MDSPKINNPKFPILLLPFILIILLLITVILGLSSNWEFKEFNIKKDSPIQEVEESSKEEISDEEIVLNENKQNQWYKLYLPEYKVSLSYPGYVLKADYSYPDSVEKAYGYSKWTIDTENSCKDSFFTELFTGCVYTIFLDFSLFTEPQETPACGAYCLNEQDITIYIYQNRSNLNIEQIKTEFIKNSIYSEIETENTVEIKDVEKSGVQTFTFFKEPIGEGGPLNGYVTSSNGYIYVVKYWVNAADEYQETMDVAQQILDSIKFE